MLWIGIFIQKRNVEVIIWQMISIGDITNNNFKKCTILEWRTRTITTYIKRSIGTLILIHQHYRPKSHLRGSCVSCVVYWFNSKISECRNFAQTVLLELPASQPPIFPEQEGQKISSSQVGRTTGGSRNRACRAIRFQKSVDGTRTSPKISGICLQRSRQKSNNSTLPRYYQSLRPIWHDKFIFNIG